MSKIKMRASTSMNVREVAVLGKLVRSMLSGADARSFAQLRARDLGVLLEKVCVMERSLEAQRRTLRELERGTPVERVQEAKAS